MCVCEWASLLLSYLKCWSFYFGIVTRRVRHCTITPLELISEHLVLREDLDCCVSRSPYTLTFRSSVCRFILFETTAMVFIRLCSLGMCVYFYFYFFAPFDIKIDMFYSHAVSLAGIGCCLINMFSRWKHSLPMCVCSCESLAFCIHFAWIWNWNCKVYSVLWLSDLLLTSATLSILSVSNNDSLVLFRSLSHLYCFAAMHSNCVYVFSAFHFNLNHSNFCCRFLSLPLFIC